MIVFPMAGLSSRFIKQGYGKPKYELLLGGETVFEKSVRSFEKYFRTDEFLFITRKALNAESFIQDKVRLLGIQRYSIFELEFETLGQADTVYQGIKNGDDQPLFIFNIDTFLLNYEKPEWLEECDGYLEVFIQEGEHWSFIEPGVGGRVVRTTEKKRISDLCSDGLYYFKSSRRFCALVEESIDKQSFTKGELYIAPMYNTLIERGQVIKYDLIDAQQIELCGTPDEYEILKVKYES